MGLSKLRISVFVVGLGVFLANAAIGATVPITFNFTSGSTTQYPFPLPFGSVATTFTSYSGGAAPYGTGIFYVGTSGTYSATLSSAPNSNGIFILTGTFAPSTSTPTTPLANFIQGEQNGALTTLAAIPLTAGVQYSYLAVFNPPNATATLTLTGPGCISFGTNNCAGAQPVPTLGPGGLALLTMLIALSGMFLLTGRRPLRLPRD
jgi:hypothetical protein